MALALVTGGADPSIPGSMQITTLQRAARRKRAPGPDVYALLDNAAARFRRG